MKILLVHNDYGKYSGEEAVVDKMAAMLAEHGHEVAQFRRTSAGARESIAGKMKGFVAGCYAPEGVKGLREALRKEKPDVVNVHNLFPFISPAALWECKKAGVPVVMTIHNFRLICPTGLLMRNGGPCEYCLQHGSEWGCVKYNCEGSMLKSIGYALRGWVARRNRAFKECVDRFACITDFQRRKLQEAGFEAWKLRLIPNSVEVRPYELQRGNYVAFCGRLSSEKGVDLIMEVARRHPEIAFKLAGEVRDEGLVKNLPENVELLGYVKGNALADFYKRSRFVMMASRCYEGFPMSILEAAQYGKCVVGPDHGGFTEIIGKGEEAIGALFKPNCVDELEERIVKLWNDERLAAEWGRAAHEKLQRKYSTEVVYRQWEELLKEVVEVRSKK